MWQPGSLVHVRAIVRVVGYSEQDTSYGSSERIAVHVPSSHIFREASFMFLLPHPRRIIIILSSLLAGATTSSRNLIVGCCWYSSQ